MTAPETDTRPFNCRHRQQDEGRAYPRSSCAHCGKTIMTGLGLHCEFGSPPRAHSPAATMEGAEPVAWRWFFRASEDYEYIDNERGDYDAYQGPYNKEHFTPLYTHPAPAAPTLEATAPAVSEAEVEAAAREIASGRYDEVSDIFTGDRDDWIIMHWHELMPTARAALEAAQRARK